MGKGDTRRPAQISRELEELRWRYAYTTMTFAEFGRRYQELKRKGLIRRR